MGRELTKLSSPEQVDGSLLRHRDLEVWGIQDFRGVLAHALSKWETLLPSNLWRHCGELWPQKSSQQKGGTTHHHPPPHTKSGQTGKVRRRAVHTRGVAQNKPCPPTTDQSGTPLGFGDFCSLLLFQAICTFRMVGQRRFG